MLNYNRRLESQCFQSLQQCGCQNTVNHVEDGKKTEKFVFPAHYFFPYFHSVVLHNNGYDSKTQSYLYANTLLSKILKYLFLFLKTGSSPKAIKTHKIWNKSEELLQIILIRLV